MSKLYMMVTITNRNVRGKFEELYQENGHTVFFETPGRGTASSATLDYFGLEATEKSVFFSVVTDFMWKKLKRALIIRMQIDIPGKGIVFTIPLSSIGGRKVLQYLCQDQEFEKEEETTLKGTDHELLVVITNQGCIDTVMDAARSANAGGGTVIHAKGTGVESAKKFLGVSLAAEKEIIFIVARTEEKSQIMKAIIDQAGMDSNEKAIVFSLPVTSAVGLRMREEDIED